MGRIDELGEYSFLLIIDSVFSSPKAKLKASKLLSSLYFYPLLELLET